eukprot:jgi/Phyca11/561392/estExt2_Genewise1.C_PHYCAscaffold_60818
MLIVFLLSAAWTFMLAVIQVRANEMANLMMNTTEFDGGNFWLLPQPDTALAVSSVVLLSLFGAGYTGLAVMMLFFYKTGHGADDHDNLSRKLATTRVPDSHTVHVPSKGFPTPIIYYYSVLLLCNWLVASYRNQRYVADPALILARLYYTFDLFFAVFAPLVVLIYFITSFNFDRGAFLAKTETLSPGTFDTVARIFGDPSEISSFCSAFHYLQFSSGSTLFYKSALNLLSLYKWKKIILTLIHNHHERQAEKKRKELPKIGKHFISKIFLSVIFLLAGLSSFIYSIGAVQSTINLCSSYHKCVVKGYHWNFGEKHCTCLVFADRQTAPVNYSEWINPEDTAKSLAELSMAGELRIVQIINRAVPALPEELRRCKYLEQLILAHLEGDFTSRRLTTIPDGIFDDMKHLAFLHIGGIPNVSSLSTVSDLSIVDAPQVATLPSLSPLVSLKSLTIRPKCAVCCNGYLSGTCNLTEAQCLPLASDKSPITCTEERISEEDRRIIALYGTSVCPNSAAVDREATAPSRYTTDELCGGIMYKKCSLDGVQGICYNTRMMVINCETTSGYIAMRKLQIQRGVGDKCNPEVEAWLGCDT